MGVISPTQDAPWPNKACDPSVGRRDGKRRGFSRGFLELAGRQTGEHLTPSNHTTAQGLTGGVAHEKSQFHMEKMDET